MRWVLIGVGALMMLMGGVWLFQGIGILLGSIMSRQPFWAVMGVVMLVVGAFLLVRGIRRKAA
jgi:positive regulator of sigma E activity